MSLSSSVRNKMYRRISLAFVLLGTLAVGVYFVYFHRPPADDILAANAARNREALGDGDNLSGPLWRLPPGANKDLDSLDAGNVDPVLLSRLRWREFIEDHNYVPIGGLFDKCDGDDMIMIGCVILLPDPKSGGLTSKTFLNVTFEEDLEEGEMFIECSYNGKALYSNHWDVCHVEDNMDERIINCPVTRGKKKFIKEMKIPNYLPKGDYKTKAWLLNADDKEIGCAFADFTI